MTLSHIVMKLMSLSIITVSCYLVSCTQPNKTSAAKKQQAKIDTANSIKIGAVWVTPKKSLEFNTLTSFKNDTLALAVCADYVYSPFCRIESKKDFPDSRLKKFNVLNRIDTMDSGPEEFNILTHNSSRFIFFFSNDSEGLRRSNVFKGEIFDDDVQLINGIKVGMGRQNFFETFFTYFPVELQSKYRVVVLYSCVDDITHTYSFKDDKLKSITFVTDSYWKVDY